MEIISKFVYSAKSWLQNDLYCHTSKLTFRQTYSFDKPLSDFICANVLGNVKFNIKFYHKFLELDGYTLYHELYTDKYGNLIVRLVRIDKK